MATRSARANIASLCVITMPPAPFTPPALGCALMTIAARPESGAAVVGLGVVGRDLCEGGGEALF